VTISPIRIGSRGSQLALWQADYVAAQLRALGHAVEIEVIRTTGDRLQTLDGAANLTSPGGSAPNGTGIFIKEIEDALLAHRIDLAVHSLKDLPTQMTPGLTLAAIPPRADARDAFICEEHWGLHMLPGGSRIATTSPRRQAMLLALRPDLTFVEMRGNIDTRLRKWSEGQTDALVLASAGLDRLGRTENVHQRFAIDELTPAPGQGALALQVRCPSSSFVIPEGNLRFASDGGALKGTGFSPSVDLSKESEGALAPEGTAARDAALHTLLRTLNCPTTEYATQAERAVLHALGGGCQLPLGAFCHQVDEMWHLHAMVVSPDGDQSAHVLHKSPLGTPASELGATVAAELTARGALELLQHPA
jgi:hydroxymethylbilane synthase